MDEDGKRSAELSLRWTMRQGRRAPAREGHAAAFARQADAICLRHRGQTPESVAALRRKYDAPLFGRVSVWSLVEKLAQCVDPTDMRLYTVSQQMHVLQIIVGWKPTTWPTTNSSSPLSCTIWARCCC